MTIASIGTRTAAPAHTPSAMDSVPDILVGVGAGAVLGGAMKAMGAPWATATAALSIFAVPVAAISLLNNTGKPSELWQSALAGTAMPAAIGAYGVSQLAGSPNTVALWSIGGAVVLGAVGAALGGLVHFMTHPGSGD